MSPHPFRSARWRRRIHRAVTLHGPVLSTLALTAIVSLLALALTHAVLSLVGGGDRWLATASALIAALAITPLVGLPLLRSLAELEAARAQLDVLATRDELTGLHNRRQFLVLADREWSRCRRYDMPAALLMIDVDLFKRVNDTHGHLAGSKALVEAGAIIRTSARETDVAARFGGDEFAVVLPDTGSEGAVAVANRIRDRIGACQFLASDGLSVHLTASIGVSTLPDAAASAEELMRAADVAMYRVKDAGKNGIVIAQGASAF